MPYLLCVETATEVCSVALFKSEKLLAQQELNDGNQHATMLTTLITTCLAQSFITVTQLDAIVVSKGPGSYTGLRVGVATAKGLCVATQKPLIAINTLQAMANFYLQQNPFYQGLICPMIDARRMEVYTAVYDNKGNTVLPTQAMIVDATSFNSLLADKHIVFIGNGAQKCSAVINHNNAVFMSEYKCTALGMGRLALAAFNKNQIENVAYFEPYYLKDFVATTPKNNKLA